MPVSKKDSLIFCLQAKLIDLFQIDVIIHIMLINRYLTKYILEDLSEKMVFVGGPRQIGKTTIARDFVSRHFRETGYYNWDNRTDRRKIMQSNWPGNAELIILDEIH